jgi:hypothetical protein
MKSPSQFFFLLFFVLTLSGCMSVNKGMYDMAVPIEEQCTLEIDFRLTVLQFDDDTRVFWANLYPWLFLLKINKAKIIISIPAGRHKLCLSWYDTLGPLRNRVLAHADDIVLERTFEPQKVYTIRAQLRPDIQAQIDLFNSLSTILGGYDYTKLGAVDSDGNNLELRRGLIQIIVEEKTE